MINDWFGHARAFSIEVALKKTYEQRADETQKPLGSMHNIRFSIFNLSEAIPHRAIIFPGRNVQDILLSYIDELPTDATAPLLFYHVILLNQC